MNNDAPVKVIPMLMNMENLASMNVDSMKVIPQLMDPVAPIKVIPKLMDTVTPMEVIPRLMDLNFNNMANIKRKQPENKENFKRKKF